MPENIDGTSSTRLLNPVPEARERLGGIGNSTFYELVKAGEIKLVKIRGRSFVTENELLRYVASLTPD